MKSELPNTEVKYDIKELFLINIATSIFINSLAMFFPPVNILFTTILTPVGLTYIDYKYCTDRNNTNFFPSMLMIPMATILGVGLGYLGWGILSGGLFNPDSETVLIVKLEIKWSIFASFILTSLAFIKLRVSSKRLY